jgi:hypothetical protein
MKQARTCRMSRRALKIPTKPSDEPSLKPSAMPSLQSSKTLDGKQDDQREAKRPVIVSPEGSLLVYE